MAGDCSSIVQVWMLQFWEAGKAQRGDELMGVDMLLFDVKISFHIRQSTLMPATVNVHRLANFRDRLQAADLISLGSVISQHQHLFHKLEGFLGDPRVVVTSSINPKMHMLVSKAIGITPVPSLLRVYAKVKPLTIAELNEFVIISEPQAGVTSLAQGAQRSSNERCHPCVTCSNTTHQTIAGTSLSGRHQETLGIKVFKGGQEAT
ncbi:hypothetical protein F2Q69_00033769 [Brassica cretica]|uniref:Uncharacterized protein n=1 Tax=Brassica cretica TaxID=69181 RepID=A0A8S9SJ94_BRACR|nr:hypothetical protein F2Q69_00033769 [Brassica cretica]